MKVFKSLGSKTGFWFGLPFLVVAFSIACRHKAVIPDYPAISFYNDISPILASNCAKSGCHDLDSKKQLVYYEDVINYVTPGNANKSQLYKSVTSLGGLGSKPMPPDQPLSEDQLKLIYVWIMQGAKHN